MAQVTGLLESYDSSTNRESLINTVTIVAPKDTLFYSALKETDYKPKNTTHSWPKDTYRAAASNIYAEGATYVLNTITVPTKASNYMQVQQESFVISKTQQAISDAGNGLSVESQTTKVSVHLAKDIEYAFLRQTAVAGSADEATTKAMKGALNWLTTNIDKPSDATLNASGTVTGGTTRPLTKSMLKELCQDIYTQGGNPTKAFCGSFQHGAITSFVDLGNSRTMVEKGKLNDYISVIVFDDITLEVVTHRNFPTDVVFVADMSAWRKATLRPLERVKANPGAGSYDAYVIEIEHTLEARAEEASGRITSLTTE